MIGRVQVTFVGEIFRLWNYTDRMIKAARFASGLGCLASVLAPLVAILLYPKANWLFAFVLMGIIVLVLNSRLAKDPTPQALADEIERLLMGKYSGWDVDNFESQRIRDPQLRGFFLKSMEVNCAPETWVSLDEHQKDRLKEIIRDLRSLGQAHDAESRH